MGHTRGGYVLSGPTSHASVDAVPAFHVFVVIRPVGEVMLTLVAGIGPLA